MLVALFIMIKLTQMHMHVENVAEGDVYEVITEPFHEQQQPAEEAEIFEDLNQSSEEPKALEEGKHQSITQF